ncbi:interleukin-12 subunit alpha [Clarias gariepinus]|uniref:interleukin-12 subunit alpha n=1 Tax=Clarias gariepinus TaxID=13013 RepID=UPI00234CF89D|nr:interleukin-12 subunit alpha [Clarias gariepinus]
MLKTIFQCLLLSLLCVLCSAGPAGVRGVPIHLSTDVCQGLGRALLQEATDVLEMDQLFRGLNCSEQSAELRPSKKTLSVCTPQSLMCSEGTLNFTFDQDECLQSVVEDLQYYRATFKSYGDPDRILEQSVIKSIENLMQSCFSTTFLDGDLVKISVDPKSSFERRLKLCKVLKGFQIRTITINRVLNHVISISQS